MCLFFETIKVSGGKVWNLEFHMRRMMKTLLDHFGAVFHPGPHPVVSPMELPVLLEHLELPKSLHKCKVIYSTTVIDILFEPYKLRSIGSFKIVYDDTIEYSYKYLDRRHLEKLFEQRGHCDDIIIVKNGLVTDSFIGNLVFFDGKEFHTPARCLLEGTARSRLIEEKQLIPVQITIHDIIRYKYVFFVNAMNDDFHEDRFVPVKNIVF